MAGRPPSKPAVSHLPEIREDVVRQDQNDIARFQRIEQGYTAERDLVNQCFGRIQMAAAIGKLATVASLCDLARIKESKAYKSLSNVSGVSPDGEKLATVATWDGFCAALGMSRRKVDEDLQNLGVFGADALEALQAAGAGYRELRQLRELPGGARERAQQAKTIDELRELLEDAEASRERLTRQMTEQQAELQAKDRVLEKRAAKIDALAAELETRFARAHEAIDAVWQQARAAARAVGKLDDIIGDLLLDHASDEGRLSPSRLAAAQALTWLVRHCMRIADEHDLQWDLQGDIAPPSSAAAAPQNDGGVILMTKRA